MSGLLSEVVVPNAPVMVIFGGNPMRRHEVLSMFAAMGDVTAYGTLSEEEGLALLSSLPRVDLVLIGGRYDDAQRRRIRAWLKERRPATPLTEPGLDYPYDNEAIRSDVRAKLGLRG